MRKSEIFNFVCFVVVLSLILVSVWIILRANPNDFGLSDLSVSTKLLFAVLIISIYSYVFSRHLSEIRVMEREMKIMELSNYFKNVPELCNSCKETLHELYIKYDNFIIKEITDFELTRVETKIHPSQILNQIKDKDAKDVVEQYFEQYNKMYKFLEKMKEEIDKVGKN